MTFCEPFCYKKRSKKRLNCFNASKFLKLSMYCDFYFRQKIVFFNFMGLKFASLECNEIIFYD